MQEKKYTLYERKEANQKATVLHSTSSASAGAHLHAIYMVAHSDHSYSNAWVSIIADILWLFPLCCDSPNQLRI